MANKGDVNVHPFYKRFKRGDQITSQTKQVILNVFYRLSSLKPQMAWSRIAEEAGALTGVHPTTVLILKGEKQKSFLMETQNKEGTKEDNPDDLDVPITLASDVKSTTASKRTKKGPPRPVSPRSIPKRMKIKPRPKKRPADKLDEAVLTAIRLKANKYFERDEAITVQKLLDDVNADEELPNFKRSNFYRIMVDMGLNEHIKRRPKKNAEKLDNTNDSDYVYDS